LGRCRVIFGKAAADLFITGIEDVRYKSSSEVMHGGGGFVCGAWKGTGGGEKVLEKGNKTLAKKGLKKGLSQWILPNGKKRSRRSTAARRPRYTGLYLYKN